MERLDLVAQKNSEISSDLANTANDMREQTNRLIQMMSFFMVSHKDDSLALNTDGQEKQTQIQEDNNSENQKQEYSNKLDEFRPF